MEITELDDIKNLNSQNIEIWKTIRIRKQLNFKNYAIFKIFLI